MGKFIEKIKKEGFKEEKNGVFAKLKFTYYFKEEGGERFCITIAGKRWYESRQKNDGHIVPVANGTI